MMAIVSASPVDLVTWACDGLAKYDPAAHAERAAEDLTNERRGNESDMGGLQAKAGRRCYGGQSNTPSRPIHLASSICARPAWHCAATASRQSPNLASRRATR